MITPKVRLSALAALATATAVGVWGTRSERLEVKLAQLATESGSAGLVGGCPVITPPPVEERRRAVEVADRVAEDAQPSSPLMELLEAASELAPSLDPAVTPSVVEMVELLCLVMRSLDAGVRRETLEASGIRVQVEADTVGVDLPVALDFDRQLFHDAWLRLEFDLRSGHRRIEIQRMLTPAAWSDAARSELSGGAPVTSAVRVDFGEWRMDGRFWAVRDGWFDGPSLSDLTFISRPEPILDSAGVDAGCLTPETLVAWAASLPWLGPEPPRLAPGEPLARFHAAAEDLARELDPGKAPSPTRVVDFLCFAIQTLGSVSDLEGLTDDWLEIERTSQDAVRLRMPVHAGVTAPCFRAAFLTLELEDLDGRGAEILVWRELIPSLADHPMELDDAAEDPRFSGIEPISSWVWIDVAEPSMEVGDVRLASRDSGDWRTEPREEIADVPMLVGRGCLAPEALRAFADRLEIALAR